MKKPARKSPVKTSTSTNRKGPATSRRQVSSYEFENKRVNIPDAGLLEFSVDKGDSENYAFDPYQDPRFEWAGREERLSFALPNLTLHTQENVSTRAMLDFFMSKDGSLNTSFFHKSELPPSKKVDFYRHDIDWRNRFVLGDSLLVMNSLLKKESMAGKVQCVYFDPPYGIKFNSNFQASIYDNQQNVDKPQNFSREPEQIQAYRDTWHLDIHSYLTFLRDRLFLAKELLSETGAIFLQINAENLDVVAAVCGEIFGRENQVAVIPFRKKTMPLKAKYLEQMNDFILFYAKDKKKLKYRQLYTAKKIQGDKNYKWYMLPDGSCHAMSKEEISRHDMLPKGSRIFRLKSLEPSGINSSGMQPFTFEGKTYPPPKKGYATDAAGMRRLAKAQRLQVNGNMLNYRLFYDDYPISELNASWMDTAGADKKCYVVQTNTEVVRRCLMMTCQPGDLVFDPTCGSGTTAYVAEQWGLRWITCDTSRVALHLARQRLITATFDYYTLKSKKVNDGFLYKALPHITLESITKNSNIDNCRTQKQIGAVLSENVRTETLFDEPKTDARIVRVTGPFTVEALNYGRNLSQDMAGEPLHGQQLSSMQRPYRETQIYFEGLVEALKIAGVVLPGSKKLRLHSVRSIASGATWVHAEAQVGASGANGKKAFISFGPKHAAISPAQVFGALAESRGAQMLIFVGLACDVEAQKIIAQGTVDRELLYLSISHDIVSSDILKTKVSDQLFSMHAVPDVGLSKGDVKGEVAVSLRALDSFDPNSGEVISIRPESIAAILIDHDFDGVSFNICQALFPHEKKDAWESLQRALKGTVDEKIFRALQTTKSNYFRPGHLIAVKVIDERGMESMQTLSQKSFSREKRSAL